MNMTAAYQKARRIAQEQNAAAVVVVVDAPAKPRAQCYDAVTLDDYQADAACGQFFDYVAEVEA